MATACVVPPPLRLDEPDARGNSPPAIISLRGVDAMEVLPGGTANVIINEGSFSLSVIDADVEDTVFVAMFVNYSLAAAEGPRATCQAAPTERRSAERTITCSVNTLCSAAQANNTLPLEIDVYDKQVDPTGTTPPFRTVPKPGLSSSRSYFVHCASS